ncbi:urea carboxylase-associated family protein [Labrys wisconsinensis]|uniref:Uncharacterized protein YcgI (DUF1989 family) n=1 Tax=Labrys wisconsinensis TaxID=425677 RepID=A0ABU0JJX5_9HYPH|nr:urea carboxylase-associated family protein [Labrys wisconsinensis]MDQ0474582.1 uncharacterized protein YcgI (DUF1989 family) [Labrys wisconsinensis]
MTFDAERELVLPAGHGRAIRVAAGTLVRLTNPWGTQAVDSWAFNAHDLGEFLSMDHLRSVNSVAYVDKGVKLVSNQRRPLLTILEDTSAGRHDTLLCPCNAAIYRELGHEGYHRSCSDNLHEALAALGIRVPFTPAALNLFMSVRVESDGTLTRLLPASRPGASILLRAELDLVIAFSSCPQDITTINGADRTPRDCVIRIGEPAPAAAAA